jgi:hypothetical protein
MRQDGQRRQTTFADLELRAQVLQSMINEKLVIAKAVEDSVTVTDDLYATTMYCTGVMVTGFALLLVSLTARAA